MADVSENLGFTLVNPQEDGDEALNLFVHLNFNWILADAAIGNLTPAALKLGMDGVYNTMKEGAVEELLALTGGKGFDCVIECSGSAGGINTAIDIVKMCGRIGVIGMPGKEYCNVKYAPFDKDGNGNMGYLFSIDSRLAAFFVQEIAKNNKEIVDLDFLGFLLVKEGEDS